MDGVEGGRVGWIVVQGWDHFQHRDAARQQVPTWIKAYTELLSDEAFLDLTPHRRSLLLCVWLEYARTRRRLPDDTATLSRRFAQRVLRSDLEALNRAGFLAFSASEPASEPASPEKRREEKKQQQTLDLEPGLDLHHHTQPRARDTQPDDDHEPGEEPAAAAASPATEREIRNIVAALPGADRQSLNVVEPLANAVPRQTLLDLADRARTARTPVGWLVQRLRSHAADTAIERTLTAAPITDHNPEPIKRPTPAEALERGIRRLTENGHDWPTIAAHVRDAYTDDDLDTARAIYDDARDPEPNAA